MRDLPSDLAAWKNSEERALPLVTLYDIEVSSTETLRLVEGDPTGTGTVDWGGHTYTATAMQREELEQNLEGDLPSFRLVVSNIDGVAGGYIEREDVDGRRVTIRTVLLRSSADPLEETYTVLDASYNRRTAVLNLGPPNFFKRKTNPRTFVRQRCQWPWEQRFLVGSGCGYPGDEFGPDTAQDFLPGVLGDAAQERLYGWSHVNASKLSYCDSDGQVPDALFMQSASTSISWAPGELLAPYFYRVLDGDFDVETRVDLYVVRLGIHAGVLAQSVEDEASWVLAGRHQQEDGDIVLRLAGAASGVSLGAAEVEDSVASYVRLVRSGSSFSAFYSLLGETWTALGDLTVSASSPIRVGLVLSAPAIEGKLVEVGFPFFRFRSGGNASCERTLEACRAKRNAHRYFGFPGIPTVR